MENSGMYAVFKRLGFALSVDADEVRAELDLRQPAFAHARSAEA
jgi:hypothetical protein